MQTGSSETVIGWKTGKKTLLSLYGTEWKERGYGLRGVARLLVEQNKGKKEIAYN
jgi:hypothetical protein